MISWNDVKELQNEKLKLQVRLNELINSSNKSVDDINSLKAEILYIDKQIEKILGKKEINRQKELKKKKSGIENLNEKKYFSFHAKYKRISNIESAVKRIIGVIENYNNEKSYNTEIVKVKI